MMLSDESKLQASSRTRWAKRSLGAVAAVAVTACVSLGLFAHHADVFQHDAARVLRQLQESHAIAVTLTPRQDSSLVASGVSNIRAWLFPLEASAEDADRGVVPFAGRLTYQEEREQFNFTLVDGRGYVTVESLDTGEIREKACMEPGSIPPLHTLEESLMNARVIDAVADPDTFQTDCASGKLVEFMFANEPFVFCAPSTSEVTTVTTATIHGQDMAATLQFIEDNNAAKTLTEGTTLAALSRPPLGIKLDQCEPLDTTHHHSIASFPSSLSAFAGRAAVRASDALTVAQGRRRLGWLGSEDSQCECKDGKKACLFVHGLGRFEDLGVTDEFASYWSDLESTAKCCSSVKFMRMDTMHNAWYDDLLPTQVCDAAIEVAGEGSPDKMALQNIAIVAHSMGNLIMSMGKIKGLCGIDSATSKWISLSPPMAGSQASNLAMEFCKDRNTTKLDDPVVLALTAVGICPMFGSVQSLPFYKSDASNATVDAFYEQAMAVFGESMTSQLCGVSGLGITSRFTAPLGLLSEVVKHASKDNDGVVDLGSCSNGRAASEYSTTWKKGKYYKARINHSDATFKTGDGWWGEDRQPFKWFNCQF